MIEKIKNKVEIVFWKFAIYLIKRGYGANCSTSDLEDFSEMYIKPKDIFHQGRCPSCRSKEVCDWIKEHIELLEM